MLLEDGRLADYGPVADVVKNYLASSTQELDVARFRPHVRRGSGWARITDLRLVDENGKSIGSRPCDKDLTFVVDVEVLSDGDSPLRGLVLELMFFSAESIPVMSVMNVDDGAAEFPSDGFVPHAGAGADVHAGPVSAEPLSRYSISAEHR